MTELDEPGLFLLGVELLDSAGQTLFETLERQLKPLYGDNWFSLSLVRSPEDKILASRDLSALLVQIEIRNNNNFRLAIRAEYKNGTPIEKSYFEHLKDLRITRNEWLHRIIYPITTDELYDLCKTITEVFPLSAPICQRASMIFDLLSKESFSRSDLLRTSKYVGGYIARLEEIEEIRLREQEQEEILIDAYIEDQAAAMEEFMEQEIGRNISYRPYVPGIGDPYTGSLLPQKYTLKLDGTIVDRREGLELKEKLGENAIDIGQLLLKNHPSGGRLRISSEGIVVGYEDEEWVVIGSIDLINWFDT